MSKAAELAALIGSQSALSNRNLIINGAMQVAQRGTSSTTNGFGSLDRFQPLYGGGTITHSQETLTGDSPYNNGFRNFIRLTVTSAGSNSASDFCYISYKVEAQDVANSGWQYASSNSSVSIQFWVRTSVAGTYYTSLQSADGTARAFVFPVVLSANTWTKVTKAIPGDSSTLEFANDTGTGLQIIIRPHVGTNYSDSGVSTNSWYSRSGSTQTPDYTQNWQSTGSATFDLTGVQLEVGEQATPFEHRSFGDVLKQCERYYEKTYPYATAPGTAASYDSIMGIRINGFNNSGNEQKYLVTRLRTEKRASPTTTYYNDAGNTGRCTTYDAGGTADNGINIGLSISGTSMQGFGPSNGTFSGISCFMEHDAEL